MKRSRILEILLFCFILGVAAASFLFPRMDGFGLFLAAAVVFVLAGFAWERKSLRLGLLCICICLLGVWRYEIAVFDCVPGHVCSLNRQSVELRGRVGSEVRQGEKNNKFELTDLEVRDAEGWNELDGRLLVYSPTYPKPEYGDRLRLECDLSEPEPFDDFAYDEYLARYGIYSVCFYPELELIANREGISFPALIFAFKERVGDAIDRNMGEPAAGLLNTLLLANKQKLDENLKSDLSHSGLSHIAAISGLHIGVLTVMVGQLLFAFGLRRSQVFWLSSLSIGLYIIMVGAPASAMRAGLMGGLVLLSMCSGRLSSLWRLLLLAGFVLIAANPLIIKSDPGFQLSFAAVMGIALLLPHVEAYMNTGSRLKDYLFSSVFISLGAQIFTWPLILKSFSGISLVFLISNILVLWVLPFLFLFAFAGLLLTACFSAFGPLFMFPAAWLLGYIAQVAAKLSGLDFAYIEIQYAPLFPLLLYYIIILYLMRKRLWQHYFPNRI